MPDEQAGSVAILWPPPARGRIAAVLVGLLPLPCLASAQELAPLVSPDRIEDAPSTRLDPYPTFDNFARRAFIALNWLSLVDAAHRGEPDRDKTLGDPGPRVWETFKSRYELFEVGPNGQPVEPSAWVSYDGRNPCGAGVDNRQKTLASFIPYAEFNQPGFTLGEFLNPLVAENRTYTRYEIRLNKAEYDAIAARGWSETLEAVVNDIRSIQQKARSEGFTKRPAWPMIVMRTPKGWTCPKEIDGKRTEGYWRSHVRSQAKPSSSPAQPARRARSLGRSPRSRAATSSASRAGRRNAAG